MRMAGFSLIECMIYQIIFCMLCFFTFNLLHNFYRNSGKIQNSAGANMGGWAAMQRLAMDIQMADADAAQWRSEPGLLSFKSNGQTISWKIKNKALLRSQGASASVVAMPMHQLHCALTADDERVRTVSITLEGEQQQFCANVRVCNG